MSVDESSTLLAYLGALEENFDNVGQVLKAYTMDDGGLQAFDDNFFDDIGVEDQDHRRLFDEWLYLRSLSESTGADSV